ncbi:MAG: A24 family peptidase [Anaerolineae bacterium]|nr:A24 family peptidase [Anaerolineae bacterium]
MAFIEPLVAAVLGLLAGGLVNMLADDLPHHGSVGAPHYPDGARRPFLGLIAFLTGRRASPAGRRLGWRYPLVEIVLALAFAALAAAYEIDVQLVFYLVYVSVFVLVVVVDLEHRLILFVVMVPAAALALLDAIIAPDPRPTLVDSLAGGALGFGVFWVFWYGGVLFNRARFRGEDNQEVAFGFGDVMLAGVCGLILGWQSMIFAMFITVFAGALGGLVWILSRVVSGTNYAMFTALPYGPYIVFGTVVMLFFRDSVQTLLWRSWRWS